MDIQKNNSNSHRFDINHIADTGYPKDGQQVKGIRGYHGRWENIIGWVLEKIFHKTVSIQDEKGNKYYLNCNSLIKWSDRARAKGYEIDQNLSSQIHNAEFVQNALSNIKKKSQRQQEDTFEDSSHSEPESDFQDSTFSDQKEENFHKKDSVETSQIKRTETLKETPQRFQQETPKEIPPRFQIGGYGFIDRKLVENAREILEKIMTLNFTPKSYDTKNFVEKVSNEFEALTKEYNNGLMIEIVTYGGSEGQKTCLREGCHFFVENGGWGSKNNIFGFSEQFLKDWPKKNEEQKNDILQNVFSEMQAALEHINRNKKFREESSQKSTATSSIGNKTSEETQETSDTQEEKALTYSWEKYNPSSKSNFEPQKSSTPVNDPFKSPIDSPNVGFSSLFSSPLSQPAQGITKDEPSKALEQGSPTSSAIIEQTKEDFKVPQSLKLDDITDDNIGSFDFSTISLTKEIINRLFDTKGFRSKASVRIPLLSAENIYELSPFLNSENLWYYINDSQVSELDFSKMKLSTDHEKRSMVHSIFNQIPASRGTDAEIKIPSLSIENIYFLAPHFSNSFFGERSLWDFLSDEQVLKLDFSKLKEKLNESQYSDMLASLFNYIAFGESNAKRRLPLLKASRLDQFNYIENDLNPNAKHYV